MNYGALMDRLFIALGESDCENLGDGFLAQPINAVSSLAFTVVALALVPFARSGTGVESVVRWVFLAALAATGVGSFLYHGPQGPGSQFLHDITFVATLELIAVANLSVALGWSAGRLWAVYAAALGTSSLLLAATPTATNALAGIAVLAVFAGDIALRRRSDSDTRWSLAAGLAMVMAIIFFVLGRTDSPVCDSDSLFQAHALWHILSAVAISAYFVSTGSARQNAISR